MEPHSPLQSDDSRGRAIQGRALKAGKPAPAMEAPTAAEARGLRFERYYTTPGVDPFDTVEWELRNAVISNEKGEKVFEQ
jgi:ribonucleoside-diphosphate reductase alpha chain